MCNLQILDFWIFDFSFFKISDIGILWSKITIFIIEISLKLYLLTKYGWNNPNSCRLGLKSPKLNFLPFLAAQKFIAHTNIQIHARDAIFIINGFFLNACNNVLIRINNNWNYKKMQIIVVQWDHTGGKYFFYYTFLCSYA